MYKKKPIKDEYIRVYKLHEKAEFIFYVNDYFYSAIEKAWLIEGTVAKGWASVNDKFQIFSCDGIKKGEINILAAFMKNSEIKTLEAGKDVVSLILQEENNILISGQMLIKMNNY